MVAPANALGPVDASHIGGRDDRPCRRDRRRPYARHRIRGAGALVAPTAVAIGADTGLTPDTALNYVLIAATATISAVSPSRSVRSSDAS